MPSYGLYARDNWQINRSLTFDYGVRYESYPAPRRDHWLASAVNPNADKVYRGGFDVGIGQLAPRVGIAYRINKGRRWCERASASALIRIHFRYLRTLTRRRSQTIFRSLQLFGGGHVAHRLADSDRARLDAERIHAAGGSRQPPSRKPLIAAISKAAPTSPFSAMPGPFNVQAAYAGSRGIRQTAIQNINSAGPDECGNAGRALFPILSGEFPTSKTLCRSTRRRTTA